MEGVTDFTGPGTQNARGGYPGMGMDEKRSESMEESSGTGHIRARMARAQSAKAAKAAERAAATRVVDGYLVHEDINGLSTIIEPIAGPGPRWYIGDGYEIGERIEAHRRRYAERPVGERSGG